MSERNNAKLVIDALQIPTARRRIDTPIIMHSDQGSSYASGDYQGLLLQQHMLPSMSHKGECDDNAESICGTLK